MRVRQAFPNDKFSRASSGSDDSEVTCYLCGSSEKSTTETLDGVDIRKLWNALGTTLSTAALGSIRDETRVTLFRCTQCGFRYFDPSFCGSGQFYTELGGTEYYASDRPEFLRTEEVLKQLVPGRILDLGCGDGAFLDRAAAAGWKTYGSELNSVAAAKARSKGHEICTEELTELGESSKYEPFDVVTAFQLLEHVPNPVAVLSDCRKLVRAGGTVAIAVPYDNGIYKTVPLDPHQWPPHHLSRWRKPDLRLLGKLAGLEVETICVDTLYGSTIEYFLNLQRRLLEALNRPTGWLYYSHVAALLSFLYRKTGMKYLLPGLGQSIFGKYRRRE